MASFFRTKIAERVLWCLESGFQVRKEYINKVAPLVKVSRHKSEHAQLFLPVNKFLEAMPEVNNDFSPDSLIRSMRNQGLPTAEGILDITFNRDAPQSLVFTVDKHVFNRIVLIDVCVEFNNITRSSCILRTLEKKNLLITYRSPIFGRVLTFNHMRALIYANFIANIGKFLNQEVNFLHSVDDWGPNCGLLLHGFKKFGVDEELEGNASNHLSEVLIASHVKYQDDISFQEKVSGTLSDMEKDEPLILSLHRKLHDAWMKDLRQVFKRVGIVFTDVLCDSVFHKRIKSIADDLIEKGIIQIDCDKRDIKVNVPSEGEESLLLHDTPLEAELHSLVRTISSAIIGKEYAHFDEMYFVDQKAQAIFYRCVIKVLEVMGFIWSKNVHHVYFRKLHQASSAVDGSESASKLLDQVKTLVLKELKMDITLNLGKNADDIAESLALASLIITDSKLRRSHNYSFSWSDIFDFGGDTGIAYQFLHAGLVRLQEESTIKFKFDIDLSPLSEPIAVHLVQHLARFDEFVLKSYTFLEPAFLVQYIQTLGYLTKKALNVLTLDIKEERLRVVKARLLLFHATQKVLHQSLKLLGITPLSEI